MHLDVELSLWRDFVEATSTSSTLDINDSQAVTGVFTNAFECRQQTGVDLLFEFFGFFAQFFLVLASLSDDFIEPQMYEAMMREIREGGYRIVQVSRDEIGEDGKRRPDVCVPPKEAVFRDSGEFLRTLLLHEGDCSFCTKLTDAALFRNRRFPEGELNEDFYLLLQLLTEADGVRILPGQLYHVYYRMGSNTRKKDRSDFSRVFVDIVKNADYAQKLTKERFPQYEREAARFGLYQRLDYLLHIPVEQMNRKNAFYREVVRYCRANVRETVTNPYLTGKQRLYLLLLAAAPRPVRALHRVSMRVRGK